MEEEIKQTGYEEALKKVIDIRINRKKFYGDSWKSDSFEMIRNSIENKAGRLKVLEPKNKEFKDKIEDTLIDLINYSLFYLQNLIEFDKLEKIQ